MAILVGVGIGSAVIRYYYNFDNTKDKQEVFTTALTFAFILSVVLLGALEILSSSISDLVSGSREYSKYFQIIFICLVIQNVYLVPEGYLMAQKKSVLYSILSIGTFVSSLSLNIFFVVILRIGVLGILISMLITKALNMLVVSAITLWNVQYSFSWEKLKEIISFGLPLMPATIGLFIIHFSDRFFIQRFCNLHDVGIYSLGYKFGMILTVFVFAPFFRIWNIQRFEIAETEDGKQIFGRFFTYYSAVIIFVGLGISVLIEEIINIMAASEYHGAAAVVPLIVLSYLLYGMAIFFSLGIMITKKTKYAAYIQLPIAGINILFNFLLIRSYGIMGAAISTFLSFLLLAIFTFAISQKIYTIPLEYKRLFILFALAVSIFGISRLIGGPLLISLGIKSLLVVGFPLALLWGKFFREDEIGKGKELLRESASRYKVSGWLTDLII
jgi:O-antigen/teichoic acid export membrane protein